MDEASLEIVDAEEMYPKKAFVSDDGNVDTPFPLLCGENPLFRGRSSEGLLIITNYRMYHNEGTLINIPLGLIEYIECKEIFYIYIYCKEGRSFRCVFESGEECQKWAKRLQNCTKMPDKLEECFAFRFLSWTREEQKDGFVAHIPCSIGNLLNGRDFSALDNALAEAERMGFDLKKTWKVSRINEDFKLCSSYPQYIVVPSKISDKNLWETTKYRSSQRIPAVVWRHQRNGCVIARSSQPRMGIMGWRNEDDENLITEISAACLKDPGYREQGDGYLRDIENSDFTGEAEEDIIVSEPKKLLIIDARSYAAAMTNRAKGGGYECYGYYPNCEVQFMGLANIHAIRSSFASLRALCSQPDDLNWMSNLENSKWLQHIAGLLRSALVAVDAVDVEERPVLVHCSDGWDRTPQIVALAEIMLDPYYRTKKGFQVLVEREWLNFGHKFADRCGHPDGTDDRNERSPVFLQWLDCVNQLLNQFKCHFEFNEQYLVRLALHIYSCLFGTFLCNTEESRKRKYSVPLRTFSVWPILNEKSQFHNYLYNNGSEVLRPSFQIRSLKFWDQVYLPTSSTSIAKPIVALPTTEDAKNIEVKKTNLVKTKSCENLHNSELSQSLQRRKSDPSLIENQSLYPPIPSFNNVPIPKTCVTSVPLVCDEQPTNVLTKNIDLNRTVSLESKEPSNLNPMLPAPAMVGSTDTLVNENGALVPESSKIADCDVKNVCIVPNEKFSSVSTDTSDLVGTLDYTAQWYAQNAKYADSNGLSALCQNMHTKCDIGRRNKSCTSGSSYTNSRNSRTPSSGFPATPCDDPPSSSHLSPVDTSPLIMEFDGLAIAHDSVQDRIKRLVLYYKNHVDNLHSELSAVRHQFLQHLCRQYHGRDMYEDVQADSVLNGDAPRESPAGSESSWDFLWPGIDPVAVSTGV